MSSLTRAHLAETVHQKVGLSHTESGKMVEQVLERIISALGAGEHVKIAGFGTFAVRQKGARVGRNPKTMEEAPIAPRRVLIFKASVTLKDQVDGIVERAEAALEQGLDED